MTRAYLVRHGEPALGTRDPGLTPLGHQQAREAAATLASLLTTPAAIVTSPLRRARETAAPLAREWNAVVEVVDAVRELPSPSDDVAERQAWLRQAMRSTFDELGAGQRQWRDGIVQYIATRESDTVVFTHAVVINVVLGHIDGHDRVLEYIPQHASITAIDVRDGRLELVARGPGRRGGDHLA